MIEQINDDIFSIECDGCGEKTAYFYVEIDPESAVEEDDWHKGEGDEIFCSTCYVPPYPELHLDDWSIQDLLKIAPERDYHTRKGIIEQIYAKLIKEGIPDELKGKYA